MVLLTKEFPNQTSFRLSPACVSIRRSIPSLVRLPTSFTRVIPTIAIPSSIVVTRIPLIRRGDRVVTRRIPSLPMSSRRRSIRSRGRHSASFLIRRGAVADHGVVVAIGLRSIHGPSGVTQRLLRIPISIGLGSGGSTAGVRGRLNAGRVPTGCGTDAVGFPAVGIRLWWLRDLV